MILEIMYSSRKMVLILLICFVTNSLYSQHVFVSPSGDDSNNGTSVSSPVKTFQRAADIAKSLGSNGIIVEFSGGEYVFESTVILDATYSGITFRGKAGETPIFSSLEQVTGWTTHSGNIMVADLPNGVNRVRYLHDVSENWLKNSSTSFFRPDFIAPCGGSECEHWEAGAAQQRKTFVLYPNSFSLPDPTKASQYDLRVHMTAWHAQVLPVSAINTSTRRIDVATPSHYSLVNGVDDLLTECWLLNSIEGIDEPGEWASIDGKIYLYPKSGTSDIYIPKLQEMIRIDAGGDGNTWTGSPVENIVFDGITFTGLDYRMSLANDVMAQHDWAMVDVPEGFLRFRNAQNCTVKNCTFTKSGADAVRFDRYAQNMMVDNCSFSYLGKNGVLMSGRGPGYGDVNKNNTVQNSHFKQTSRIKWDAASIHVDQSSSNIIKQNYIEDTPLSAIIMSGNRTDNIAEIEANPINRDFHFAEVRPDLITNWQTSATEFYEYNNLVEENTFRAVHIGTPELIPAVSSSAPGFTNGMIYTTGRKSGETSTIRKNYFYDVDALPTYSHTWVILGDGHEDFLDFHQNMGYNLNQINGYEDPPFFSNNCNLPNGCRANSNVKLNSPYSEMECSVCQNPSYSGTIDFDNSSPSGSASSLNDYIEMYSLLCGNLPGPSPLPGSSELRTALAQKIQEFGGTVPNCSLSTAAEIHDTSITIYPNPVDNFILIKNATSDLITDVKIVSILGKTIQTLSNNSGINSINVLNLSSGIYFVQLKSKNRIKSIKFIKE
ncbi:T9SS type A sorting domain-containing protein [Pseudotenacibaculum sp. MALMAid0570]|uniref:T9SS type A sorting domain-containing protein n=1 Tax=Pseudotenacibaculum sp. MALMAid0570 TaxID=3143938 RepID=UPI0032DF4B3E